MSLFDIEYVDNREMILISPHTRAAEVLIAVRNALVFDKMRGLLSQAKTMRDELGISKSEFCDLFEYGIIEDDFLNTDLAFVKAQIFQESYFLIFYTPALLSICEILEEGKAVYYKMNDTIYSEDSLETQ